MQRPATMAGRFGVVVLVDLSAGLTGGRRAPVSGRHECGETAAALDLDIVSKDLAEARIFVEERHRLDAICLRPSEVVDEDHDWRIAKDIGHRLSPNTSAQRLELGRKRPLFLKL